MTPRIPSPTSAYSFESDHGLDDFEEILSKRSDLTWRGGDNDHWGVYWAAFLPDDTSELRIFIDRGRFVIDIQHIPQIPESMPFSQIVDLVQTQILPALGARDVRPHPGWES
jgi:hypothetical protein